MNLNKVDLYKQVAKKCKVTKNDVAKILKSTEEIVFDYLAHVEENEPRKVFIMNGDLEKFSIQKRALANQFY